MKAYYTDEFVLPLPEGHRFPMKKYAMLRQALEISGFDLEFEKPSPSTRGQLALAHSPNYVDQIFSGQISQKQQNEIGFPWSEAMVERSLRSVGATVSGAFAALRDGASVNLAGGTHHAHKDRGAGFCVFNDQIVAARVLQTHFISQEKKEPKVLIIDLDVHQGDGSATLAANDPSIFTFSMHGRQNYPFEKAKSDLDIELDKGCTDEIYLDLLDQALKSEAIRRFNPEFVFYLAGHDAHGADRLGHLELTDKGIEQRNRLVLEFSGSNNCPIMMTMGGGYFNDLNHLVQIQILSVRQLNEYAKIWNHRTV